MSHTGRSREVLEAAEAGRAAGATVICLTAPHTPLSALADIHVAIPVHEEIDIYTPSLSHFAYHYVFGLIAFHLGQSSGLDRAGLLQKIARGLASGHQPVPAVQK